MGKRVRVGVRIRRSRKKKKKNEKNTTKGQNVFHFIPFKITQLEKTN